MKRLSLVSLVLALAGCGFTESHEVVLRSPPGPADHDVDVYTMGQPLPRPFYEIALLQVIGHGADATLEDMVNALRRRARALGCDAIAQVQVGQGYSVGHAFGVCVKYAQMPAPTGSLSTAPPPAPIAKPSEGQAPKPSEPAKPGAPDAAPEERPATPEGTSL